MQLKISSYIVLFFFVLFTIVFIFNYIVKYKRVKKKKYNKIEEMNYLISKFKLNKNNINYLREILKISLINSFIISFTATFVNSLDTKVYIRLAIGFVILFALIYAIYEIYGRNLKKKSEEK